ncbi:MAG: HTH domain-containing protein [Planctomycetaceae bacterium]
MLHCIMGPGRWDADALAKELEVSRRTIHRAMEALAMANVPWYFCKQTGSYRVRKGFRFPGVDSSDQAEPGLQPAAAVAAIDGMLGELARFTAALQGYRDELAGLEKPAPRSEDEAGPVWEGFCPPSVSPALQPARL